MSGRTGRHRRSAVVGWALYMLACLGGARATETYAQIPSWSIGLVAVTAEDSGSDGLAPGARLGIDLFAWERLTLGVDAVVARRDFRLGADELHRNMGGLTVVGRWTVLSKTPSFALTGGLGAWAWDDVSETDPAFRSSASASGLASAGIEARWPLGDRWGVAASVATAWSGWWGALLDPDESSAERRLLVAFSLVHR